MKKLLIFLLILTLCTFSASAQTIVVVGQVAGGACTNTFGLEANTTETCTSPAGVSEANATTGWTDGVGGTFDQNGTAQSGSYAIQGVATAASEYIAYSMTGLGLSVGTTYRLQFYSRHNGTDGDWIYGVGSTFTVRSAPYFGTISVADTTYAQKTHYFIYNSLQDWISFGENNAGDNGGIFVDNISIKAATLCFGEEKYTITDAASLSNETDDATEWTKTDSTLASTNAEAGDGTYSLLFTATAAGGSASIDLSSLLTNGKTYFIKFKGLSNGSDLVICGQNSIGTGAGLNGASISIAASVSSWTEWGWSFAYTSGGNYRYFKCHESGAGDNASAYIDSITIKEIL